MQKFVLQLSFQQFKFVSKLARYLEGFSFPLPLSLCKFLPTQDYNGLETGKLITNDNNEKIFEVVVAHRCYHCYYCYYVK